MTENATKPSSGLAIAGLVLGILAAVTSFLPIINNLSAILAVVGGILAGIALFGAIKGKNGSKGLAIAGVVLAVISFAIVLGTQSLYGKALDTALKSAKVETTSTSPATTGQESTATEQPAEQPAESAPAQEAPAQDATALAVGQTANLSDGMSITVNSVQTGLPKSYSDELVTCINVTYVNNGSKNASFNPYDWKGEDAGGAQRSQTFYSDGTDELSSGQLSPGGTVTGNIYFEDGTVRVLYYGNIFDDSPTAGWTIA
jgi:hypothetical protein